MQPTIPGDVLRQVMSGRVLDARLTEAEFAETALKGYLCATLWDWEEQRKTENNGDPITQFRMEWQVPLPPTTPSKQTVFLFNGLQPSVNSDKKAVLQPVLQWGNPESPGGGPFWSVSSWFVRGAPGSLDIFAKTKSVRVDSGRSLISFMTLTDTSDGLFHYTCEFSGIDGSSLNVAIPTELVRATTALEVYHVPGDAELPSSPDTTFKNIEILVGVKNRAMPKWQIMNLAPGTGIHVTKSVHGGIEDEVTIHYR